MDAGPALRPAAGDHASCRPRRRRRPRRSARWSRPRARRGRRTRGRRTRSGYSTVTTSACEGPSPGTRRRLSPSARNVPPSGNSPARTLGPGRSASTATGRPAMADRSRTRASRSRWSATLTMAEVEAEHVDAGVEQRVDLVGARRRRPERRHDLRVAPHAPFLSHPAPRGRGRAIAPRTQRLLDCPDARGAVHRVPVRFPGRLAVALPRGGQRGRDPGRGRLRRLRRGGGLGRRRRSRLRRPRRRAGGVAGAGRRCRRTRRSASWAPTPTRPTCG